MPPLNFLFRHHKLGIKRSDLVIEIGSGGDPLLRSDILVEKYIEDQTERSSTPVISDRLTVAADGVALPFKDKSVDYIFCCQVLEHVSNAKSLLDELNRVGKRGLIETPHGNYEMLRPRTTHLWYIWNENAVLRLKQKKSWNEFPESFDYFHKITRLPGYNRIWNKYNFFFNTTLEWQDKIDYRIEQDEEFDFSRFTKASIKPGHNPIIGNKIPMKMQIKSWLARIIRPLISTHWRIDLNDFICCPLCRGKLSRVSRESISTKCYQCGANFPVKRSIVRLLREEAFFGE